MGYTHQAWGGVDRVVWGRGQIICGGGGAGERGMWLKVARAGEEEEKDLGDRVLGPGQAARVAKAAEDAAQEAGCSLSSTDAELSVQWWSAVWERKELRCRRRLERGWGWELALFWEVRLVGEKRWWTVMCRMPTFKRQEEAEGTGQVGRDQTRPRRAYRKNDCVVHSTLGMEEVLLGTARSVLTDTSAGTEGQDSPSSTAVSTRSQPCARPCAPDP